MPRRHTPAVLHSVADLLARPVTKDQLLHTMIDRVAEALDAERGTLYLVDAVTDELVSRVAHLPELSEIRLPPGRGVAGQVASKSGDQRLKRVTGANHRHIFLISATASSSPE